MLDRIYKLKLIGENIRKTLDFIPEYNSNRFCFKIIRQLFCGGNSLPCAFLYSIFSILGYYPDFFHKNEHSAVNLNEHFLLQVFYKFLCCIR